MAFGRDSFLPSEWEKSKYRASQFNVNRMGGPGAGQFLPNPLDHTPFPLAGTGTIPRMRMDTTIAQNKLTRGLEHKVRTEQLMDEVKRLTWLAQKEATVISSSRPIITPPGPYINRPLSTPFRPWTRADSSWSNAAAGEVTLIHHVINRDNKYWDTFGQGMAGRTVKLRHSYIAYDSPKDFTTNYTLVNYSSYFEAADLDIPEQIIVRYMMGNFTYGTGPENYVFKRDGFMSNKFRNSFIVNEALREFCAKNDSIFEKRNYKELESIDVVPSFGPYQLFEGIFKSGFPPKTLIDMVGSARITVALFKPFDGKVLVTIFNITSLSSGDFFSKAPVNVLKLPNIELPPKIPKSVVRKADGSSTRFGNISQQFQLSFTLEELIKKYRSKR